MIGRLLARHWRLPVAVAVLALAAFAVYRLQAAYSNENTATPAGAADVANRYPLAIATDAPSPQAAREFATFVLSSEGRKILAAFGFGAP